MYDVGRLWRFLPLGYLFTVVLETPVLYFGLSPQHPRARRIACGLWLTAVTYPIVVLALPLLLGEISRTLYLVVAETFAPAAECAMFALAFHTKSARAARGGELTGRQRARDLVAIVVANLVSFGVGELVQHFWRW